MVKNLACLYTRGIELSSGRFALVEVISSFHRSLWVSSTLQMGRPADWQARIQDFFFCRGGGGPISFSNLHLFITFKKLQGDITYKKCIIQM